MSNSGKRPLCCRDQSVFRIMINEYLEHIADGLESKKIVWDDEAGLSYKKGRDWDDLIEKKQVEYDPKFLAEYGE